MGLKYLLDTNILSEPAKSHPNPHVLHKLNQYSGQYCTAVTVWHELHFGVERMTDSKSKENLFADGEIAAIAFTNQLTLVTRNVDDFANYDELIIQNWFTA